MITTFTYSPPPEIPNSAKRIGEVGEFVTVIYRKTGMPKEGKFHGVITTFHKKSVTFNHNGGKFNLLYTDIWHVW